MISLGIGDPDLPTPQVVVDALAEAAATRARTSTRPTTARTSFARRRRLLPRALRRRARPEPRDRAARSAARRRSATSPWRCSTRATSCLSPDPGYPPYTSGPLFAGAEVYYLPLEAEHGFLPDLDAIPADVLARANLPLPRLPEQPDRRSRRARLLRARGRARARANDLVVVHDNAYSELCFDGYARRASSRRRGEGGRRRGLLALEGLEHDRLARRPGRGQRRRWSSATGS